VELSGSVQAYNVFALTVVARLLGLRLRIPPGA